ncbi:kinesin-like protein KIN-12E [Tanacetum coccineum]
MSSGKATELLKSEEEKTKLQLQMNHESEKLEIIKKESDKLGRKLQDLDQETQTAEVEIQKCIKSTEEMENKLQSKLEEKDVVLEMKENGIKEFENMFIEFQESMFQVRMMEEEMNILKEEVETKETLKGEKITAEIARVDASCSTFIIMHSSLAMLTIYYVRRNDTFFGIIRVSPNLTMEAMQVALEQQQQRWKEVGSLNIYGNSLVDGGGGSGGGGSGGEWHWWMEVVVEV